MTLNANWSYPTTIRFGAGRIVEIADACASAGISKPLLITDRGFGRYGNHNQNARLIESFWLRVLYVCGC